MSRSSRLEHSLRQVWNRAVGGATEGLRTGDKALAEMVLLNGHIGSGGLDFALELVGPEAARQAADAFRYFGLDEAATVIDRAADVYAEHPDDLEGDALLDDLGARYSDEVPDGDTLTEALARRFQRSPKEFAPIASDEWDGNGGV